MFSTGNVLGALPLNTGTLINAPRVDEDALRNDAGAAAAAAANSFDFDENTFRPWAASLTQSIEGAMQQTIGQGGSFADFAKNLFANFAQTILGNLEGALQGAFSGGGGGGFGGFLGSLFAGTFHEGRIGTGSPNEEQLARVTADESILKPKQLAGVFKAGAASARGDGNINVYFNALDINRNVRDQLGGYGYEMGQVIQRQRAEGVKI